MDVVEPAADVPAPKPATVLVGAGELPAGDRTDTTTRGQPRSTPSTMVAKPRSRPPAPAPVGAPTWGGDCEGDGVKFGTSLGPGPDDCAETRGWMSGPGPKTRPATTDPAAAAAATEAIKGFRGRKPGRA